MRLFQNFSFGTATLDLSGKAVFSPLFQEPVPKLTEFWNRLNYLKFLIPNWDLFNSRTILAWDLGRNIALCRWGYDVGFLTEQEAWAKIMYYAKKIQPLYQSWEEYGFDYYMGRVFWASGFGEDINYLLETDPIYRKLTGESGYWHNLEWNIDLGN